MKNRRWFRLAGWLLTLAMLLTVVSVAAFAEEGTGNTNESNGLQPVTEIITAPEEVDITEFVVDVAYTDEKGKITPVKEMNPNNENRMTLTVSGLDANKAITKETVMTVTLPEDIIITSKGLQEFNNNEAVSASVTDGKLSLSWKGEKKDALEATFAILPHVKTENDLSGSYVLGTKSKVMLSTGSFTYQSRNRLNASDFTEHDGKIWPNTDVDPVWVLTHVSGDYYTIRSQNTGEYLYVSPSADSNHYAKSLYLVSADQETAHKIQIRNRGNGYYSFHYNNVGAITNVGVYAYNGFAFFADQKAGAADNEIFKLYPASALGHEPTKDLSGSWTVYNENQKTVLTIKDNAIASVRYKFKNSTEMFPNSDTVKWTFEHINRNWYTIKTGDKYLNVSNKGVSVSSTAQHLLIKSDDNFSSIVISDGEFDTVNIAYVLNAPDYSKFNTAKTAITNTTKFKLTESVSDDQFDVSGVWAITTPSSGAVLLAKANGSNKLASSVFVTMEDGTVYTDAEASISWTFTKEEGNWYSIRTEDGKYLSIKDSVVTLSTEKKLVYIQKDNDLYRITGGSLYGMNNSGNNANNGYSGVNNAELNASNEWHELKKPSAVTSKLCLDVNGGDTDTVPETIYGVAGESVTLPGLNATREDQNFIGWADVKDIYKTLATGTKHTYHDVYKPGTEYTLKNGKNTLYAVYNTVDRSVQFGIRQDGKIVDEPNDNSVSDYKGHFTVKDILKEGHWVIDIDSTKPVNDYYVENDVTAALNWVPSAEQIAAALKKEGNINFDPETQYIHYYVLKYAGKWKVDGVIRNKANVEITYDANVPGAEKSKITNLPSSYQVAPGTDILIGADENSTKIKRPILNGYYFMGWNTKTDGTGTYYSENDTVHLTENLYLYAQWISEEDEVLEIRIRSDWTKGAMGYIGAKITLIGELTGFENKEYTLQWQYTTDLENWVDIPDAHEITYTYMLDEVNTHYTWRLVARDIR